MADLNACDTTCVETVCALKAVDWDLPRAKDAKMDDYVFLLCALCVLGARYSESRLRHLNAELSVVKFLVPYFHQLIITTPPTIMQALMMIRRVTRSTSRRNNAVRISENNGAVLLSGITTETLPRSNAW